MRMNRKEYNRMYHEKNRESIAERQRLYHQTEKWRKVNRIHNWKVNGIIPDNWDEVYTWYMETTHCELCSCLLTTDRNNTATTKCLDHDHSITDDYNIRGVICNSCNASEKSKHKFIYLHKNGYQFQKRGNGKRFSKCFKTLEEAIAFRDAFKG